MNCWVGILVRNFLLGFKLDTKFYETTSVDVVPKEYVSGDDIRTLNWKATAKRNQLMVNQYIDERSQPIYSIIDKGRTMQMHFDGLSLLDYAINATLGMSSAAILL